MKTQTEDPGFKKKVEVVDIVTNHNSRMNTVFAETERQIKNSSLDEDEQSALLEKITLTKTGDVGIPAIAGLGKTKRATMGIIREIFGNDFVDHNAINDIFNKGQNPRRVRIQDFKDEHPTPYTIAFLEEAKQAGCMIVYQPLPEDSGIIGLNEFAKICRGIEPKSGGKLLYSDQFDVKKGIVSKSAWFANEQYSVYRDQQVIQPNLLRLAMKTEIAGTPNQKFVQQMIIVGEWMKKTFKNSMTENMNQAIEEVRIDEQMLTKLQDNDSEKFLKTIKEYQFFKRCMETGLETLWRMVAYEQVSGTKLLQNMYLRNNVVEPVDARLGCSGYWDSNGPCVSWYYAGDCLSIIGLGFSCTGL